MHLEPTVDELLEEPSPAISKSEKFLLENTSGFRLKSFKVHPELSVLAAVSNCRDSSCGKLDVYDVGTARLIFSNAQLQPMSTVSLSTAQPNIVYTGGRYGTLSMLDLRASSKPVINSPSSPYYSQSKIISIYQENGNQLGTMNENGQLYHWNVSAGNDKLSAYSINRLKNNNQSAQKYKQVIAFHELVNGMVVADKLGSLHVANLPDSNDNILLSSISNAHDGLPLLDIDLNCDSKLLLSSSMDGWVKQWKLKQDNGRFALEPSSKTSLDSNASIIKLKWHPEHTNSFVAFDTEGVLHRGVACNDEMKIANQLCSLQHVKATNLEWEKDCIFIGNSASSQVQLIRYIS